MPPESVKTGRPLGAVRLKPLIEVSKRFTAQTVQTPLRVRPDRDQPSVTQHLEMPRYTWLIHAQLVDELADRALTGPNGFQDAEPGRFCDGLEGCGRDHGSNITGRVYKRNHILASPAEPSSAARPARLVMTCGSGVSGNLLMPS